MKTHEVRFCFAAFGYRGENPVNWVQVNLVLINVPGLKKYSRLCIEMLV